MRYIFFSLCFFFLSSLGAQIRIENPSFEGQPQDATIPEGWLPCAMGTTPDILPGPWGVYMEAEDGETYMGLITREDGSFESITQRLSEPMKKGECYSFGLYLSHSNTYSSYNLPLFLKIWGSESRCSNDELLGQSGPIGKEEWIYTEFTFHPKADLNYIVLEAQTMEGLSFYYKGNILVDGCTAIKPCKRAFLE